MSKVVFVLGAGASRHLNFPTGGELIDDIITTLGANHPLADAINGIYGDGVARLLADKIGAASLESIDQFMRIHMDDTLRNACRLTLTYKIVQAEYHSTSRMRDRARLQQNWYYLFRQFLLAHPHLVSPACFSFLTFNYDRSFEHFMSEALRSDSRIHPTTVPAFLDVFHMHGSFGPLPWAAPREHLVYGGGELFRFEDGPLEYVQPRPLISDPKVAKAVANRLAFPHDQIDYGLGIDRRMGDMELLVILGFGFAPDNAEKIRLRDISKKGKPILATAMGLSDSAKDYLADLPTVELFDGTSDAMFQKVITKRLAKIFV